MSAAGFFLRVVITFFAFVGLVVALAFLQAWWEGDFTGGPPDVHGNDTRPR